MGSGSSEGRGGREKKRRKGFRPFSAAWSVKAGIDNIDSAFSGMIRRGAGYAFRKTIGNPLNNLRGRILGKDIQEMVDSEHTSDTDQLIIRMKPGRGIGRESMYEAQSEMGNLASRHFNCKRFLPYRHVPYVALECASSDTEGILRELNTVKGGFASPALSAMFVSATRSYRVYTPEKVFEYAKQKGIKINLEYAKDKSEPQWNLSKINSDLANEVSTGAGTVVAVIDTGVDYNHPELSSRFTSNKGYNVVNNGPDPMDDNGHGTHVAGTVAGMTVGVAPDATLYAVKVLNASGSGSITDVITGIEWAIDNGVDVINLSLGSPYSNQILQDVCTAAYRSGIFIAAACGNSYFGPNFPAHCQNVVSVCATDSDNKHAEFSNIYDDNDISAPGVGIKSALPGGKYDVLSGTSMASPHVAGVASLARSIRSKMPVDSLERCIEDLALYLGPREEFGYGLVMADSVVNNVDRYKSNLFSRRLYSRIAYAMR